MSTDQTTVMPAQSDQPDADFLASLDRPYAPGATPARAAESAEETDAPSDADPESEPEPEVTVADYHRQVLDWFLNLLAAGYANSGTLTRSEQRLRGDLKVASKLIELILAELQATQRTIPEHVSAVHSGEPLL